MESRMMNKNPSVCRILSCSISWLDDLRLNGDFRSELVFEIKPFDSKIDF